MKVIEILLGVALAFAAARHWRRRDQPRTSSGVAKKFTGRLEQLNPWEAATVGILKQPWTLTAAAAVVLVRHHSALPVVVFAFVAFAVLSTATVGLIFFAMSQKPRIKLPEMITWSVWVSIQVLNLARNAWLWSGLKPA